MLKNLAACEWPRHQKQVAVLEATEASRSAYTLESLNKGHSVTGHCPSCSFFIHSKRKVYNSTGSIEGRPLFRVSIVRGSTDHNVSITFISRLSLFPPIPKDELDFNPFTTINLFIKYVDHLIVIGLEVSSLM